jgi:hypothetical protein
LSGRSLDSQPLDELIQGFSMETAENPVKMKLRKTGRFCHCFE